MEASPVMAFSSGVLPGEFLLMVDPLDTLIP